MKKLFLLFAFLLAGINIGFCEQNTLSAVEISQNNGVFELKLNTDAPISFKKHVEGKDSVYFDIKNVVAGSELNTVYNDVADIDGVVLQQMDKNNLRIYVNGLNTQNTVLTAETSAMVNKAVKEVLINRPRSEYAPITGEEKYEETSDWAENGFNIEHLLNAIFVKLKNGSIDWTLTLSIIVVISSLIGLRKAFAQAKIEDEPLIGISGGISRSASDIFAKMENDTDDMDDDSEIEQYDTKQELIEKLNKAAEAPSVTKTAYALNSYQKMQNKNPYMNANATPIAPITPQRKQFTTYVPSAAKLQGTLKPKPAPTLATRPISPAPVRPAPATAPIASTPAPQGRNIDNIRFLESVTKIYEQSGRKDLANGLKANLAKNKIAM